MKRYIGIHLCCGQGFFFLHSLYLLVYSMMLFNSYRSLKIKQTGMQQIFEAQKRTLTQTQRSNSTINLVLCMVIALVSFLWFQFSLVFAPHSHLLIAVFRLFSFLSAIYFKTEQQMMGYHRCITYITSPWARRYRFRFT